MNDQDKKFEKFDKDVDISRKLSRKVVYQIIVLSTSIVGFSVTLFSVDAFKDRINIEIMRYSWHFFIVVILIGFLILFFEGRIKFAKAWKIIQETEFSDEYSCWEKIKAWLIAVWSCFWPVNFFSNKYYSDYDKRIINNNINGLVIRKIADFELKTIFRLENLFILFFITGLITFIISVN